MRGKHYHFLVIAYTDIQPVTNAFMGSTEIDLICLNVEMAMDRAKELVPDKHYFLRSIIEHFDSKCQ